MSRTVRYDRKNHKNKAHRDTNRDQYSNYGCSHHNKCDYCSSGRTHSTRRRQPIEE